VIAVTDTRATVALTRPGLRLNDPSRFDVLDGYLEEPRLGPPPYTPHAVNTFKPRRPILARGLGVQE
jgi:hypothetical protein